MYHINMIKTTVHIVLCLFLLWITNWYASTWETIDLSTLTPKELLEFYKQNPDYWKKRLEIDYNEYIEGEYVVFRGEYKDAQWEPIPNKAINFTVNSDKYAYVTSEKWIFNLELLKENIKDSNFYTVNLEIDGYKIKTRLKWEELKMKSIYHFQITKNEWNPHTLNLTTIHNDSFWAWEKFFTQNIKTKEAPSGIWIQWIWLYVFAFVVTGSIAFFYFNYKNKNLKKGRNKINIPSSLE